MVTKATRDVLDLNIRPITDGIDVNGDCSANFTIDGTVIGATVPCNATFITATMVNFVVSGTIDGTGATQIGTWQANYADIAEQYEADRLYIPGTVIKLGGQKEITATTLSASPDVFGLISTNPSYVLNSNKEGTYLSVVMIGRAPCRVIGPVVRGDRLVSSNTPGVARAILKSEQGCKVPTFAIVIADDAGAEERLVEVAVTVTV